MESSDLRLTKMPLNNRAGEMPALGFGTLIPDPSVTMSATRNALHAGFRHLDCAERYGNEREVGEVLDELLAATKSSVNRFLSPQSFGTRIIGPNASNRRSRQASTG